ncbi:hypothetical protein A4I49_004184 [Salmonella enterica subsp. enterica serovar Choleraesuis]|nr:hypothetical protein [Salmonella enterica subsp. enterica]EDQ7329654.1 hypothetical protein [Salmonella enterica subsp. enterica serovar Paratyphi C]EEJ2324808.1 hypothetical protein [Salmonella enterica subsp. enterica serovar Choleraesuis]EEJ3320597.1 hypothetical protein [Salmonella enterica subsp. enterica serovar Paratyphi C]MIO19038.1 hypothetical protein [Salmonella enterica subsp. enterica serovar Paratyphi C]
MSQTTVWLACYKGRSEYRGIARFVDWLTRKVTRGIYSHCELAVEHGGNEYLCYSASFRDRGVRGKIIPLPDDKWDKLPLKATLPEVEVFFRKHNGKRYDWQGALGIVLYNRERKDKLFCSEFCAEFLGLNDSWRYSPSHLYALVSSWQYDC